MIYGTLKDGTPLTDEIADELAAEAERGYELTQRPTTERDIALEPLTITYTENEDGWVTAQIAEVPEAISQGASRREAFVSAIAALHDLNR